MVVEREHEEIWKAAGCSDYIMFLRSNHLCKPDRYRDFARGVDRVGLDTALTNGAHWTIAAGQPEELSADAQAAFTRRAAAFVTTEGMAPTEETVREWKAQIVSDGKDHLTLRRADRLAKLQAENEQLKAENAALKKRVQELEQAVRTAGKKKAA